MWSTTRITATRHDDELLRIPASRLVRAERARQRGQRGGTTVPTRWGARDSMEGPWSQRGGTTVPTRWGARDSMEGPWSQRGGTTVPTRWGARDSMEGPWSQ